MPDFDDRPDWMQVLNVFYEHNEPQIPKTGPNGPDEDHILFQATDLQPDEIEDALGFLIRSGLTDSSAQYTLTEQGFQVAHDLAERRGQQELAKRQNQSTGVIAGLTVVLAISAVMQAIGTLGPGETLGIQLARLLLTLALVYLAFYIVANPQDWRERIVPFLKKWTFV